MKITITIIQSTKHAAVNCCQLHQSNPTNIALIFNKTTTQTSTPQSFANLHIHIFRQFAVHNDERFSIRNESFYLILLTGTLYIKYSKREGWSIRSFGNLNKNFMLLNSLNVSNKKSEALRHFHYKHVQ